MSSIHRYVSLLDSNNKSNLSTFNFKAMEITKGRRRLQSMIKRFDFWSCALLGNSSWPVSIAWENNKEKEI